MHPEPLKSCADPAARFQRWGCAAFCLLLLVFVPLFVRMPLTSDTVLYDLQARTVLSGGVLYRDILEPNLPGVVWVHLLVRSLVGWSSEAMRLVDLLIVGSALGVLAGLAGWMHRRPQHPAVSSEPSGDFASGICLIPGVWLLLLMATFYLSRNEWCHCQRDIWMLLPVSLAMLLRVQRYGRHGRSGDMLRCLAEGLCWGAAFWIKPHVAVPAAFVMLTDLWLAENRREELRRILLVIPGGLLAAVPGILWLVGSGGWSDFLEMQLNWNPEYLRAGAERRSLLRIWYMVRRFHPWWLVDWAGLTAALLVFLQVVRLRAGGNRISDAERWSLSLAALAVSWFLQALLLQHAMDYIQVAPILLMLTFLSSLRVRVPALRCRIMICAAAGWGLLAAPQLTSERLRWWPECVGGGGSPEMRSALACGRFPDWSGIDHVVTFLRNEHVGPGDVTCFSVHSIHVYAALNLLPSTRYVGVAALQQLFGSRRQEIESTVIGCGHRFVVTDNDEVPPEPGCFPWTLPVVCESGSLRVHAVR